MSKVLNHEAWRLTLGKDISFKTEGLSETLKACSCLCLSGRPPATGNARVSCLFGPIRSLPAGLSPPIWFSGQRGASTRLHSSFKLSTFKFQRTSNPLLSSFMQDAQNQDENVQRFNLQSSTFNIQDFNILVSQWSKSCSEIWVQNCIFLDPGIDKALSPTFWRG